MSPGGVRKLIARGKLAALKLSAHKTVITRGALESYKSREGLATEWRAFDDSQASVETFSVAELREKFESEIGESPESYVQRWRTGEIDDSPLGMRTLSEASLILVSEAENDASARS